MDSNATSQSESTPTTIFNVGDNVRWKDHTGIVRFISDRYITVCISTQPNDDPFSKHNQREVCLLVYSENWKDVEVYDNNWRAIILHCYHPQRNSFYHFPQPFPQETNNLWKTRKIIKCLNKWGWAFSIVVNVSENCSLSTFPNDTQPPTYKHSECVTNHLTIHPRPCIITLPRLIREWSTLSSMRINNRLESFHQFMNWKLSSTVLERDGGKDIPSQRECLPLIISNRFDGSWL